MTTPPPAARPRGDASWPECYRGPSMHRPLRAKPRALSLATLAFVLSIRGAFATPPEQRDSRPPTAQQSGAGEQKPAAHAPPPATFQPVSVRGGLQPTSLPTRVPTTIVGI